MGSAFHSKSVALTLCRASEVTAAPDHFALFRRREVEIDEALRVGAAGEGIVTSYHDTAS